MAVSQLAGLRTSQIWYGYWYVPAVVPGATVIVPLAFMVMLPMAGVGAAPGARVTLPPAPTVACAPLSVSLARTEATVAPLAPLTGPRLSSAATITAAPTVTVAMALSQLVGLSTSQIWYGY